MDVVGVKNVMSVLAQGQEPIAALSEAVGLLRELLGCDVVLTLPRLGLDENANHGIRIDLAGHLQDLGTLSIATDHLEEPTRTGLQAIAAGMSLVVELALQGSRRHCRDDQGEVRLLAGESAGMKAVRRAIQQVAGTDSTVLITGETGTGKELVARAIHQLSSRRDQLLVSVNCAALASSIIASELFGHEAGAFTGAVKRRLGRFELAHRGTIFLDEVGDVPAETQVMLLRVLQERSLERVGGGAPVAIDVRVIAATHRDLAEAVAKQGFRADLYFRLNVFPIHLPALRERRDDIPTLVRHFVQSFNRRLKKRIGDPGEADMHRLMSYPWPGNVRELENVIERAMILGDGPRLHIDPAWLRLPRRDNGELAEVEKRAIVEALERTRGRVYGPQGAASLLGLKPTTLYGKMRKLGIRRER